MMCYDYVYTESLRGRSSDKYPGWQGPNQLQERVPQAPQKYRPHVTYVSINSTLTLLHDTSLCNKRYIRLLSDIFITSIV